MARLRSIALLATIAGLSAFAVSPAPTASFPLHDEAAAGDPDGVELMLMTGYPVDARNARSSTALHIAAVKGHNSVASVLLQNGAPVNAPNADGNTPLHAAVEMGQVEIAKLLLANGADALLPGEEGMTPLRIATCEGHDACRRLLIEATREYYPEGIPEHLLLRDVGTSRHAGLSRVPPRLLCGRRKREAGENGEGDEEAGILDAYVRWVEEEAPRDARRHADPAAVVSAGKRRARRARARRKN